MANTPVKPALQAFLEQQFGGSFFVNEKSNSVTTTAGKQVDHNFERMGLAFMNLGANDIYIAPSNKASTTNGFRLAASGGFISFNARQDLVLPGHEWYGVSASGSSTLYVVEVLRYKAS